MNWYKKMQTSTADKSGGASVSADNKGIDHKCSAHSSTACVHSSRNPGTPISDTASQTLIGVFGPWGTVTLTRSGCTTGQLSRVHRLVTAEEFEAWPLLQQSREKW